MSSGQSRLSCVFRSLTALHYFLCCCCCCCCDWCRPCNCCAFCLRRTSLLRLIVRLTLDSHIHADHINITCFLLHQQFSHHLRDVMTARRAGEGASSRQGCLCGEFFLLTLGGFVRGRSLRCDRCVVFSKIFENVPRCSKMFDYVSPLQDSRFRLLYDFMFCLVSEDFVRTEVDVAAVEDAAFPPQMTSPRTCIATANWTSSRSSCSSGSCLRHMWRHAYAGESRLKSGSERKCAKELHFERLRHNKPSFWRRVIVVKWENRN